MPGIMMGMMSDTMIRIIGGMIRPKAQSRALGCCATSDDLHHHRHALTPLGPTPYQLILIPASRMILAHFS